MNLQRLERGFAARIVHRLAARTVLRRGMDYRRAQYEQDHEGQRQNDQDLPRAECSRRGACEDRSPDELGAGVRGVHDVLLGVVAAPDGPRSPVRAASTGLSDTFWDRSSPTQTRAGSRGGQPQRLTARAWCPSKPSTSSPCAGHVAVSARQSGWKGGQQGLPLCVIWQYAPPGRVAPVSVSGVAFAQQLLVDLADARFRDLGDLHKNQVFKTCGMKRC